MTFELQGLPETITEETLKKVFFKDQHVIDATADFNNITGKSTGKAKVKVRCQNGLKSDQLLKKLYSKGAKFRVTERIKQHKTPKNSEKQIIEI